MAPEVRSRFADELRGLLLRSYTGMDKALGTRDTIAYTTAGKDIFTLMRDGQSFLDRLIAEVEGPLKTKK